jgi:hypothetical protein
VGEESGSLEVKLFPLLVPAGSDTEVQYNDNGLFGADSTFTFNDGTGLLSVGSLDITGITDDYVPYMSASGLADTPLYNVSGGTWRWSDSVAANFVELQVWNADTSGIARALAHNGAVAYSLESVGSTFAGTASGVGDIREPSSAALLGSNPRFNIGCSSGPITFYLGGDLAADKKLTLSTTDATFGIPITASNYTAVNLLTACATNAGELDFTGASKKLDVEDNAVVSQDYSSNAAPAFAGLTINSNSQYSAKQCIGGDGFTVQTTVLKLNTRSDADRAWGFITGKNADTEWGNYSLRVHPYTSGSSGDLALGYGSGNFRVGEGSPNTADATTNFVEHFRISNTGVFTLTPDANTDLVMNWTGTTNSGVLTWMEDEDYFKFSDEVLMDAGEKINLRDTAIGIYSQADTFLDLFADGGVRIGNSSAGAPTNYTHIEADYLPGESALPTIHRGRLLRRIHQNINLLSMIILT